MTLQEFCASAPIRGQKISEVFLRTPVWMIQFKLILSMIRIIRSTRSTGAGSCIYSVIKLEWCPLHAPSFLYMVHHYRFLPNSGNASILSSHTHVISLVSYTLASRTRTSFSWLVVPLRSLDKLLNGINRKWCCRNISREP